MNGRNLLETYFKESKKNELAIFCGAGISVNSGVPQVLGRNGIIPYVLKKLGLRSDRLKNIFLSKRLPFESIFETLISFNQNEVKKHLLNIFDNTKLGICENSTHLAIAKLALSGKVSTIITTNFDTLIESTFDTLLFSGKRFKQKKQIKVYNTYNTNSEQSYDKINWSANEIRIIKIHGCITRPKELIITISQISKRRLQNTRQQVINDFFSNQSNHKKVAVIGYSASDEFDIIPYINNVPNPNKSILYINHNVPSWKSIDEIHLLKNVSNVRNSMSYEKYLNKKLLDEKKSGLDYRSTEIELQPHNPFVNFDTDNYWWQTNTDSLIDTIFPVSGKQIQNNRRSNWQNYVDDWANSITYKSNLLGQLFNLASESKIAFSFYKKYQIQAKKNKDREALFNTYFNQGDYYYKLGKYIKSLEIYSIAKKHRLKKNEKKWQLKLADIYISEANSLKKLGNWKSSLKKYRQANTIYNKQRNALGRATAKVNIATILSDRGKYIEAVKLNNEAIKIDRRNGRLNNIALTLGNQSGIFLVLQRYAKAQNAIDETINIYTKLNDQYGLVHALHQKANIIQLHNNNIKAFSILKKAESLCLQMNYKDQLIANYSMQASIFFKEKKLDLLKEKINEIERLTHKDKARKRNLIFHKAKLCEAERAFQECLKFYDQLINLNKRHNELSSLADNLLYKAYILEKLTKYKNARKLILQAFQIYQKLNLRSYIAECEKRLADLLRIDKEYVTAEKKYKSAYRKYLLIKNEKGIAQTRLGLGILYRELGKYSKSINHLDFAKDFFENTNNNSDLAITFFQLGHVHSFGKNKLMAEDYYNKASYLYEQLGNKVELGNIKNNLANLLSNNDLNSIKKIQLLEEAKGYFEETNTVSGLALVAGNLGLYYFDTGQLSKALSEYKKSDVYYQKTNDKSSQAHTLSNLSNLYLNQDDYETALLYSNKALKLLHPKKDELKYAEALCGKAKVYLEIKHYKKSEKLLVRVCDIYDTNNLLEKKAFILYTLCDVRMKLKGPNQAFLLLEKSFKIFEKTNNYLQLANTSLGLGTMKRYCLEYQAAIDWYLISYNYYKKLKNNRGIGMSTNSISDLLCIKGEFYNALKYYRKSKKILESGDDINLIVTNLINGGNIYTELKRHHYAHKNFEQAEQLCLKHNLRHLIPHILNNKARVEKNKGEFHLALKLFLKASKFLNSTDLINNYLGQTDCLIRMNSLEKAWELSIKTQEICNKLKIKNLLAPVFVNQGLIKSGLDNYSTASKSFCKALTIYKNNKDHESAVDASVLYAFSAINNKKYRRAIIIIDRAINRHAYNKTLKSSLLWWKAQTLLMQKRYILALSYVNEASMLVSEGFSNDQVAEISNLKGQVLFYLKEHQLAIQQFDKALNLYKKRKNRKGVINEIKELKKISLTRC